ncbi:hypothetical protein MtrunA17_Chr6g0455991 [Medicago truncatula]|uniref:Uncharacterized protein n=1 Tax=Medicago truncatula TaxID=3880 RepID=A0A396HER3_MEDTR|nr:hypothetical protein MtrunA17_Chr6g0455991 [Medicago truncatula]
MLGAIRVGLLREEVFFTTHLLLLLSRFELDTCLRFELDTCLCGEIRFGFECFVFDLACWKKLVHRVFMLFLRLCECS